MRDVLDDYIDLAARTEELKPLELAALCLAQAINRVAHQLAALGNRSDVGQGAIEELGDRIKDGLEMISESVSQCAVAVAEK